MREARQQFAGFPASRLTFTPVPDLFFTRVLPQIEDVAELKVTLHLFWLLHHKRGAARYVTWEELAADRTLLGGLPGDPARAIQTLAEAMEKAVARGTVINVVVESAGDEGKVYVLNTEEGRRTAERLRLGELALAGAKRYPPAPAPTPRSPLIALYEQQIGLLTPGVAAALARAARQYGEAALADAIAEAVRYEKRHWAYISRVLENQRQRVGGAAVYGEED